MMRRRSLFLASLIAFAMGTAASAQTPASPPAVAAPVQPAPAAPMPAAAAPVPAPAPEKLPENLVAPVPAPAGPPKLYGQIGRMVAVAGRRDDLVAILLTGTRAMPGCLSYVVAKDADDPDAIWVSEVWDSEASHDASFDLPTVQDAMTRGRPLIARVDTGIVTTPIGGTGLPR